MSRVNINVTELSETDAIELRNSGADYLMLDQHENALKHLSKSLEYEPSNTLTLRLLADVYYMLNQHDSALRNLNKLLQIEPNDKFAFRMMEKLLELALSNSILVLDMKDYQFNDTGVTALAKALESNSSVTHLNLQYNQIEDTGATALAEALKSNTILTSLTLNHNQIGDTGATALAKSLESNSSLTHLNLQYNQIGDIGAAALAKSLESNSSLTCLDLQYNWIGNTEFTVKVNSSPSLSIKWSRNRDSNSGIVLEKILKLSSALAILDLNNNQIGDAGAAALAKALEVNTALRLKFNYNQIGDTGAALANFWKNNRPVHEIVCAVNDLVILGSLLLLYPPSPENWVNTKPGLDQVVKKLSSLTSLEFKLTDALIGDALILFEHKFRNIGDILINAFTIVTKRDILSICLRELLNPERTFNHYDLFEFVINVIDKPEEKILFQLEEYAIENPMMDVFQDNNGLIPQACTILKYPSIMYEYMLVKFGTKSRVTRYLMKEIITAHIGKAKLIKFYPSLASSVLMDFRWQELDYIFNTYCMAGVPFEPEFLPLVKTCPSDTVIKCLFDGYLSRLFGFKVEFTLSRVDQLPIFNIIPFTHREHNASSEANKEKVEWLNAINCNQYEPITDTFRRHLEKFRSRLRLNLI